MKNTLVISGWSVDFACSAALACCQFPNSEVIGMSKRGLPVFLDELAGDTEIYDQIFILGIPLMMDEKKLLSACRKLHKRKTKLTWFCSYPIPPKIPRGIEKYILIPPANEKSLLCKFSADQLNISKRIPLYRNIGKIAKSSGPGTDDASRQRAMLIEAAMSRFRRFQDKETFPEVIRLIAANAPLGEKENVLLREYSEYGSRELRGSSKAIGEIKNLAKKVGLEGRCGVLITGETGTGKETVANLIHGYSPRNEEPFIAFNCADLTPQLIESRLFGHEKGAFTGADRKRQGAFELADGGTLFLDEIAELPLGAQAGLLRVLQEGRFFKLGGEEEISVDVRIIAATNRNLVRMIEEGRFREDLFYRLNVVNIHIPPLRERIEDIRSIADSLMINREMRRLSKDQLSSLENYNWPGNVRELENILERSVVLKEYNFNKLLTDYRKSFAVSSKRESEKLNDIIRDKTKEIYEKYECNKTHTAKAMGISINTLKKYLMLK